jgi:hypothetical protein
METGLGNITREGDLLPVCLVLGNAMGSSVTRHRPPGSPMSPPPRTCPGSST